MLEPLWPPHPLHRCRSRRSTSTTVGALQAAVGVLAAKWSVAVLARLGVGTHRFNELLRQIDGVSRRMLSATLRQLERDGLVERHVYARVPARVEYELSAAGEDLLARSTPLAGWGIEHRDALMAARARFDDRLQCSGGSARASEHPGRQRTQAHRPRIDARSARSYWASWSHVQSRGSLSSRQRAIFAPWRMRPLLVWSKVTSTTSSGRSSIHSSSRSLAQRLGSPMPRSPVSYGGEPRRQLALLLGAEAGGVADRAQLPVRRRRAPRISEPTVPSSLPGRQPSTTASIVRTRLILTMPDALAGLVRRVLALGDDALGVAAATARASAGSVRRRRQVDRLVDELLEPVAALGLRRARAGRRRRARAGRRR